MAISGLHSFESTTFKRPAPAGCRSHVARKCSGASGNVAVAGAWADWFSRSFLLQLDDIAEDCRTLRMTRRALEQRLCGRDTPERPLTQAYANNTKAGFRRQVASMLPSLSQAYATTTPGGLRRLVASRLPSRTGWVRVPPV